MDVQGISFQKTSNTYTIVPPITGSPKMDINAQKEPINRRNYITPTTAKTELIVHHGRSDEHRYQREYYGRVKNMQ